MTALTLTRRQIIDEAKRLVLAAGPGGVLESGMELFTKSCSPEDTARWGSRLKIVAEARIQARRVYTFLGYDPPGGRVS